MADPVPALVKGTLDLLVLRTLELKPLHGAAIAERIFQTTRGTFHVKAGSLFPALHRLEEAGWLSSTWNASENNRRAKFYVLTKTGRKQLGQETEEWNRIAVAIARALEA